MRCFWEEDGIRDIPRSRGLGDVYKRQHTHTLTRKRLPCSTPPLQSHTHNNACVTEAASFKIPQHKASVCTTWNYLFKQTTIFYKSSHYRFQEKTFFDKSSQDLKPLKPDSVVHLHSEKRVQKLCRCEIKPKATEVICGHVRRFRLH